MFPEQPQPTPTPPPANYLDQIAPKKPTKNLFKFGLPLVLMIGGGLIIIVAIISIVLNMVYTSKREPIEHMAARLATTETIASDAQSKIKSSKLRSLNSNLSLYLANTNRDISEPLLGSKVDPAKISQKIKDEESGSAITDRLEDARLNSVYDRVYANEMSYQLANLINLMKEIYATTSNEELKELLRTTYANLEPTQEAFSDFNAANG